MTIIKFLGKCSCAGVALLILGCQVDNTGAAAAPPKTDTTSSTPNTILQVAPASPATLNAPSSGALCNLDIVSGLHAQPEMEIEHGHGLTLEGWAISDGKLLSSLKIIFKASDKVYEVHAPTGLARPDVANALHQPALMNAGFAGTWDISGLPNGKYELWAVTNPGSQPRVCDLKISLTVR